MILSNGQTIMGSQYADKCTLYAVNSTNSNASSSNNGPRIIVGQNSSIIIYDIRNQNESNHRHENLDDIDMDEMPQNDEITEPTTSIIEMIHNEGNFMLKFNFAFITILN
ncbi:unnamed protein product [Amaranthus hypochondriacus]